MKILLLNQTFFPDVASTAQHLQDLALELIARGHEVTVLASRRAYDDPRLGFLKHETWRGIEIFRISSTGFGKAARWRRALDFGSFLAGCCMRLARLPRYDVIVALTSPPLISFIGAWLAKMRQCRFVYWIMDLNPDEALTAGWLKENSIWTKGLQRLSRFSLRRADRIIALDQFMQARIRSKGIAPDKIRVIPPWSHDDAVQYDEEGRRRFRQRYGLEGKFVVMYSGNHSPCHPLDTLMAAAKRMAEDKKVVFCFVGGGSEFRKIQQMQARHLSPSLPRSDAERVAVRTSDNHQLHNILCLPYQPLDQLAGSLSAADLHVVIMGDGFVGMTHPCKIYNILTIGAPFLYLGPKPSHLSEVLDQLEGCQRCARTNHGDVEGIVRHIRKISELDGHGERKIFEKVAARFSRNALLPRLVHELES